jgi:hypothetical protein
MVAAFFKIWAIIAVVTLAVSTFFRLLEAHRKYRRKSSGNLRADYHRAIRAAQSRVGTKTRIVSFESRPDR